MFLWRISNHADLSGTGGEYRSGRWHQAATGIPIVYLAEHPAVALLENLANLRGDPTLFPDTFQMLRISLEPTLRIQELTASQTRLIDPESIDATQAIGNAWLAGQTSALLRVPSIPSPESWNYLLNPLHPDAATLKIEWAKQIVYDKRSFHLSNR